MGDKAGILAHMWHSKTLSTDSSSLTMVRMSFCRLKMQKSSLQMNATCKCVKFSPQTVGPNFFKVGDFSQTWNCKQNVKRSGNTGAHSPTWQQWAGAGCLLWGRPVLSFVSVPLPPCFPYLSPALLVYITCSAPVTFDLMTTAFALGLDLLITATKEHMKPYLPLVFHWEYIWYIPENRKEETVGIKKWKGWEQQSTRGDCWCPI